MIGVGPAVPVALAVAALACTGRGQVLARRAAPLAARGSPPTAAPAGPAGVGAWWAATLHEVGAEGDPRRWARVAAGTLALVGGGGGLLVGPGGALVGVGLVVVGATLARPSLARRRADRDDARLPEVLEQTARALRSGLDLLPALEQAATRSGGAHGRELARVVDRARAGAPLVAALSPWAAVHPRPAIRLAVAALEVAGAAGGPRARALDGVAATLRAREAVRREVRAVASQASASAAVLVALPLVVGGLSAAADPRLAHTLLATPAGLGCVLAAVVLDALGALWMRRVLRAV